jgi:hypothetical protein
MIRIIPTLVTAPTVEPVTLAEVKDQMRIKHCQEDAYISTLIKAARIVAEKYMRVALMTQTWKLTLDLPTRGGVRDLPDGVYEMPISALYGELPREIDLPYKPLASISSVQTYDSNNTASTYSSANYFADTASGRLILNRTSVWPSDLRDKAALVVTYVAGHVTADLVPQSIKTGIKQHVQKMFDSRIECDMPPNCMHLYDMHKIYG